MQEPQSTGGLARDVWEINHKDIKLTQRLGKGMFGEVILCYKYREVNLI